MTKKASLIRSAHLAQVDYAYATRVPTGMDLLFFAGACPLDQDGKVPNQGDYSLQAKLCVENLKQALKESGATLEDVIYTRVLVASGNQIDLVMAWDAIREEFGEHDVPAPYPG
ncbi:RidA family protein [Neobacillus sp. Marseille-QA0830]